MGRRVAERAHASRGAAKGKLKKVAVVLRESVGCSFYYLPVGVVQSSHHDGLSHSPPVDALRLGQSECLRRAVLFGELRRWPTTPVMLGSAPRRVCPSPPATKGGARCVVLFARYMDRNPAPCEGSDSFAVMMVRGRAGLTSTSNLAAKEEPAQERIQH